MKRIAFLGILCGLFLCSTRVSAASGEEQADDKIIDGIISGLHEKSGAESKLVKDCIELMCSLLEKMKVDPTAVKAFIERNGPPAKFVSRVIQVFKEKDSWLQSCVQSIKQSERNAYEQLFIVREKELMYEVFSSLFGLKDPRTSQEKADVQGSLKKVGIWFIHEIIAGFRKQEVQVSPFVKELIIKVRLVFEAAEKEKDAQVAENIARKIKFPDEYVNQCVKGFAVEEGNCLSRIQLIKQSQQDLCNQQDLCKKKWIIEVGEALYGVLLTDFSLKDPRTSQEKVDAQKELNEIRIRLIDEVIAGFRKQEKATTSEFIKDRLVLVSSLYEAMKKDPQSAENFVNKLLAGSVAEFIAGHIEDFKKAEEKLQLMSEDRRKLFIAETNEEFYSYFSKEYGLKDPRTATTQESGDRNSITKEVKKLASDNPTAITVVAVLGLAALTGLVYKVVQMIRKKQQEKETAKMSSSSNGQAVFEMEG